MGRVNSSWLVSSDLKTLTGPLTMLWPQEQEARDEGFSPAGEGRNEARHGPPQHCTAQHHRGLLVASGEMEGLGYKEWTHALAPAPHSIPSFL